MANAPEDANVNSTTIKPKFQQADLKAKERKEVVKKSQDPRLQKEKAKRRAMEKENQIVQPAGSKLHAEKESLPVLQAFEAVFRAIDMYRT